VTVFPGFIRNIQPSVSLAELEMPADVKEQLKSIATDLQARTQSGPVVALFVSKSSTNAIAAAEAVAHALNQSLVHVDVRGMDADATAKPNVNLQQDVQTLDARQVILFFDEADSLFHKRTAVRGDGEATGNPGSAAAGQGLPSFDGLTIVSTRAMPETAVENLRYTVHFQDGPS
jgi:hypothetical protein